MEQPWVAGSVLGARGVRREGDDKFTTTGAPECRESMTDDIQGSQLSVVSEVKSRNK